MSGAAGLIGGKMKQSAEQKAADRQYQNDIKARDEQREYDRGALDRLVVDAERAGFNPLTVLRAGGTSYQNSGAPLLSRREVGGSHVADGIMSAADSFLQNWDPYADQKREQQYRLVESQIAANNASTLSGVLYGRGSYASSDYDTRPTRSGAALGKPTVREPGKTQVTNPHEWLEVAPTQADAAAYEERYGEAISDFIVGPYIAGRDWLHNVTPAVSSGVNWIRENYSKPLSKKIIGGFGQLSPAGSPPLVKPPKPKDTFSDPFPAWAW